MPDGAVDDRQAPSVEVEPPQVPVLDQKPTVLPESSDIAGEEEGEGEEAVNLMQPQVRKKEKGKKKAKKNGKGGKTRDEPQDEEVPAEVRYGSDLIPKHMIQQQSAAGTW